jgi:hypothetical protein
MRSSQLFLPLIAAGLVLAQEPPAATGVSPEWDVKANMSTFAADVRRIEPVLRQVKPAEWVEKGAPKAYVRQLQSSQNSLQNLVASTNSLAQDPNRLSVALETFFRMEKMELLLGSLREGVRKYQSADIADQLTVLLASNSVHRDRLRQHLTDLATVREEEFKVVDEEAQRCRSNLSRQGTDSKVQLRQNRKASK